MGRLTPFIDDLVLGAAVLLIVALIVPEGLGWALVALALWFAAKLWLFRAHLRRPAVGVEAMVGRAATALEDLRPRGQVDLDGEIWNAESTAWASKGERLRVEAVEGLTLKVAPLGVAGGALRQAPRGSVLVALAQRLGGKRGKA